MTTKKTEEPEIDLEAIKKQAMMKFVEKAMDNGFNQKQAEFLWKEIKKKVAIDSLFGGFF